LTRVLRWAFLFRTSYETKTDAATIRTGRISERVAYARERATLRTEAFWSIGTTALNAPTLRIRARLEGVTVGFQGIKTQEFGGLAFAEITWKPLPALSFSARATAYNTASFETAIWQFEPHVAGVLANTGLYGKGARYLALLRWEPVPILGVWLRGEMTTKDGVTSLGSGQLEIQGNTDARLTAQVEVRL
jgi:hypothetical protein